MLYLGVRRSDVVKLGPGMVKEGVLSLVPQKTRYKRLTISYKPILPELARIIHATKIGMESFLETARGKPFSVAGFGNWFRDRCMRRDYSIVPATVYARLEPQSQLSVGLRRINSWQSSTGLHPTKPKSIREKQIENCWQERE